MMTEIRCVLTVIFLAVGLFFMAVSVVGVIKFPDFFSRLHAIGLGQSLGIGFCCFGLFIYQGPDITGLKILMVLFLSMLAGPIGTHIVDRVAFREGLKREEKNEKVKNEEGSDSRCL